MRVALLVLVLVLVVVLTVPRSLRGNLLASPIARSQLIEGR